MAKEPPPPGPNAPKPPPPGGSRRPRPSIPPYPAPELPRTPPPQPVVTGHHDNTRRYNPTIARTPLGGKDEFSRPLWEKVLACGMLLVMVLAWGFILGDPATRGFGAATGFSAVLGICVGLVFGSFLWNSRWH